MYGIFSLTLLFDFYKENVRYPGVKALIAALLYGLLVEWLQSFTVYRSFEWADFLSNVLGALSVVLFYKKRVI